MLALKRVAWVMGTIGACLCVMLLMFAVWTLVDNLAS